MPMTFSAAPWWMTLMFFFTMHFVAGIISSTVFQAAHVVPETAYPNLEEDGSVQHNWFVHQLKTTCNFSSNSRIFSWYVGGLNYQIEHHLFPNISHIHYRKISEIVRKTSREFHLPYHEHSNFATVMWAHAKHLWRLGRKDAVAVA
ncbi:MAG: linoleoyl-CoA desaturase [Flavobacteriales bacterium]